MFLTYSSLTPSNHFETLYFLHFLFVLTIFMAMGVQKWRPTISLSILKAIEECQKILNFQNFKLYVQLSKEKLGLQAKVDVAKDMDMHIKVEQVGPNMREQITIFLDPSLISWIASSFLSS